MERRLLLVFALTFLVIILFQPLLKKYVPQPVAPPTETRTPVQPSAPPAAAPPAGGGKKAASESETVVENDLYRIAFTNRGGLVKSWILKKYDDDHHRPL